MNLLVKMDTVGRKSYGLFFCDYCRQEVIRRLDAGGKQKSCGCTRTTHGKSKIRLYSIWEGIIQRCKNPRSHAFKNYGGRGISLDPSWRDPTNFISWAEKNGYKDNLSIDRIDNDGNYAPDNCHWIPWIENHDKGLRERESPSRISPTLYIQMMWDYHAGDTFTNIGKRYGISRRYVNQLLSGKYRPKTLKLAGEQ
jgi:hypothetical protein